MGKSGEIVDVLVVGAGSAGGAFVWSLSESGYDVMCLEQGPWLSPEDAPSTHEDWELHTYTDYNLDPNYRKLPQDYPINNENTCITPLMINAVGGSGIHWGAHFPRMRPSDFRVKDLDGVADNWPLTYYELEPYFDLNDRMVGVSGLNGNPAYPPMPMRQTPPLPIGKHGETIARGFEKLGWHWWPAESAINSEPYDGRPACNNCGPCILGCHNASRASSDVTYWPKAIAKGASLKTGCRVKEVTVNKHGFATGVIYYDEKGILKEQKASVVVLACNGVGTPRLLLNSVSPVFPNGLANHSGLVGRNLMFHPVAVVDGVFEENLQGFKGPLSCSITSYEFYETDVSRGFVRGSQLQVNRSEGPVHVSLGSGAAGNRVPWGEEHHRIFSQRMGNTIRVAVMGEDLPELSNRVELDDQMSDSDGVSSPKINYVESENSKKLIEFGIDRAIEVLGAAGAKSIHHDPLLSAAGWHLMGTARMGTNPERSVVDRFGACHDVRNLYVIDGSIFVTAGAVNPTSTIQALALYIADNLKKSSRFLGVT